MRGDKVKVEQWQGWGQRNTSMRTVIPKKQGEREEHPHELEVNGQNA
jgi:hypothetical protein